MTMESKQDDITILQQAEKRLRRLSPERLRVVSDFLAALEEKSFDDIPNTVIALT